MSATYTSSVVAEARSMHEGGWSIPEITQRLRGRYPRISSTSVRCWVDERYYERHKDRDRAYRTRMRTSEAEGRFGLSRHTLELQALRVCGLFDAGLTVRGVSNAMCFDYGNSYWTQWRVRRVLGRA